MVATFVLMDQGQPQRSQSYQEITEPYGHHLRKIRRGPRYPELIEAMEQDYHVRFYDLDMSSPCQQLSKYLDWVFEVMGAEFPNPAYPQTVHLKYVKEVLPAGMITSSVEQEGMISNHVISSERPNPPKPSSLGKK